MPDWQLLLAAQEPLVMQMLEHCKGLSHHAMERSVHAQFQKQCRANSLQQSFNLTVRHSLAHHDVL